jgi:phosphoenolpyruvate synthase/pyruvate phosphate dikinase
VSRGQTPFIRWFDELTLADRPYVGGKSASLGELTRAGIAVPPGFVVTTEAFEQFLAHSSATLDVRAEIQSLAGADETVVAAASREIRRGMLGLPIPAEIEDGIRDAWRILAASAGLGSVAVRSSATCEDSEAASFAGLQDTYLWTEGESRVVDRVRSCWSSLYNAESISYRRRLDLDEKQLAMAVVVQSMVDAACAGVMFTRSPTTGDRTVVVVEACWGLGSCLVGGEVTPDRFVVNKVTGEVLTRDVSVKAVQHLRRADGNGIQEMAVDADLQGQPCLSDRQLSALWQIARQAEAHYGSPQDIEWAIPRKPRDPQRPVLLLQSRPETIWSNRRKEPAARPMPNAFDHVLSVMSGKKQ